MLSLILQIVLDLLDENGEYLPDPQSETAYAANRIRNYLTWHFEEDLSVRKIGNALNMSPSTVAHVFRDYMGISPFQYLQQIRIGEAQTLLITTDLSIRDIALRCGYNSAENMYVAFRKSTGMSPSRYRMSQHSLQN